MAFFDTRPVTEAKLDTEDGSRKDLERRYAQTEELQDFFRTAVIPLRDPQAG